MCSHHLLRSQILHPVPWKWTVGLFTGFGACVWHFLPDAAHIRSEVHWKFLRSGRGNEAFTVSDTWLTRSRTETVELCACVCVRRCTTRVLMFRALTKWPAKYIKRRPIHSASQALLLWAVMLSQLFALPDAWLYATLPGDVFLVWQRVFCWCLLQ